MNVLHVINGELVDRLPELWQRRLAEALAVRLASDGAVTVGASETHRREGSKALQTSSGGEAGRNAT